MATTFVLLLVSFIILFIMSRVMGGDNKIDTFAKYLGMLAFGLLLGAGAHHYFNNDEQPEKTVVTAISSTPTQQVSGMYTTKNSTAVSQESIERDILVVETEGNLVQQRKIVEIEDDS